MSQEQGKASSETTGVPVVSSAFTLSIDLGNNLMRYPVHIADALRKIADDVEGYFGGDPIGAFSLPVPGLVWDGNGNKVGRWEVS